MQSIPFNKPFLTGKEIEYIRQAVDSGKISGNGSFTRKCQGFLEQRYGFGKVLLTTSCTDALEMAAILANVGPDDEVIVPSFTFVSSALAFVRSGARIVFADSRPDIPNLDVAKLERLITPRTKVIVPVHYAGMACDMDGIMALARIHNLLVVEDAAQAIDSAYQGKALGGIGHFGCFSFHETKNINSGEGGALAIRDAGFFRRSEIIWEKGTNRTAFFRGETDKYGWVDTGSSFLPSEISAAFLYAQLENIDGIQAKRKALWNAYAAGLAGLQQQGRLALPRIPDGSSNNAHMFYVVCASLNDRSALIRHLQHNGILAVFHYQPLHKSAFYANRHEGGDHPHADRFADRLLRLPMFYDLAIPQAEAICAHIRRFYAAR